MNQITVGPAELPSGFLLRYGYYCQTVAWAENFAWRLLVEATCQGTDQPLPVDIARSRMSTNGLLDALRKLLSRLREDLRHELCILWTEVDSTITNRNMVVHKSWREVKGTDTFTCEYFWPAANDGESGLRDKTVPSKPIHGPYSFDDLDEGIRRAAAVMDGLGILMSHVQFEGASAYVHLTFLADE